MPSISIYLQRFQRRLLNSNKVEDYFFAFVIPLIPIVFSVVIGIWKHTDINGYKFTGYEEAINQMSLILTLPALVTLGAEPGLSINTLRQILNLSHPGTVRLVDRLAAQGLVERRAGADGRTLALFLTDAGHERRQAILTERRQQLQLAMNTLTPEEQEQLTKLMEKMLTAMTTTQLKAFAICRLCEEKVCPRDYCPVDQQYCRMWKK